MEHLSSFVTSSMAGTPGAMAARGEDNTTWPTVRLARQLCFSDCNIQREKLKFKTLSTGSNCANLEKKELKNH
jgi:hypothetical protein